MAQMIEMNLRPDAKTLRQFGFIAVAGFGFVAAIAHYDALIFSMGLGTAKPYVVNTFIGLAAYSGIFSLIFPKANLPVYVGLTVLSYPIGYVVSHVIMGALFFGMITPMGVVMRMFGRDPLERKLDPEATTYWRDCRPPREKESYFRQF
ncbi:MAG: hypothetical protein ACI8W3_002147 [Myxococcota bacterium]|jgi:hypothetical protein